MPELERLTVRLSSPEVDTVHRYAQANDLTVSAAMRQLIAKSAYKAVLSPEAYRACVEAVARAIPGLPRGQLEALVSIVLSTLHNAPE